MEKYIKMAQDFGMKHAFAITPEQMVFDIRVLLKCRWGCENFDNQSYKCRDRNTTFEERVQMIQAYKNVLLLHNHDGHKLSRAAVEIERQAFLDGNHLAFAIRYCNVCKKCAVDEGNPCVTPLKVRPCEGIFGIDVYETARLNNLPCYPLKDKDELQNRFAFVCIS